MSGNIDMQLWLAIFECCRFFPVPILDIKKSMFWYIKKAKLKSYMISLNSLWPCDAIRQQGTESTLAQVMACCLKAPSNYLNQCWLIISKFLWHSSEGIIMRRSEDTNQKSKIEITFLESHSDLPGANELTPIMQFMVERIYFYEM